MASNESSIITELDDKKTVLAMTADDSLDQSVNVDPEKSVKFDDTLLDSPRVSDPGTRSTRNVKTKNRKSEAGVTKSQKRVLVAVKFLFGVLLFLTVLTCTVLSKLTLVNLTERLWLASHNGSNTTSTTPQPAVQAVDPNKAVTLYWQLFLVLIIPSCVTFIRAFIFGVLGKSSKSYPWPSIVGIVLGIVSSTIEVLAMCVFVFLVLAELPPGVGILLLNGVFVAQILIDLRENTRLYCCGPDCSEDVEYPAVIRAAFRNKHGYSRIKNAMDDDDAQDDKPFTKSEKFIHFLWKILETRTTKTFALLLQVGGIFGFVGLWVALMLSKGTGYFIRPMVGFPIVLIVMSVIWSNRFQELVARPHLYGVNHLPDLSKTARYKSSFITSSVRIALYPFISYIIFRFATTHQVDPWCVSQSCHIDIRGDTLYVMVVQIITTFLGYIFAWTACTMTLSHTSMALPLLLSTPVSAAWYYLSTYTLTSSNVFPSFTSPQTVFREALPYAPLILLLLWVGELLAMLYFLLAKMNIILSADTDMFLTPHYDGVFLEQHMILNRQVGKRPFDSDTYKTAGRLKRHPRTIFICSTMYRENEVEMKQMLTSISRVAQFYEGQKAADPDLCDTYESHIFFDGAINGSQLQTFGLQLFSLLEETLHIRLKAGQKERTPYGYRFTWYLGMLNDMRFTVHFKDKNKVKAKKRWSQVMYMNYVLNYRIHESQLNDNDTYILTTDADIDFTADSAVVLLDMLAPNNKVAAVCARTHPKGSGPIYWYQLFDYAIGHWFQKPAEHILGCVLCSPGCFSVFRCRALREVLEEYSSEVSNATEFLMKDMGEDRWLCTLLIKKGWRLEYCAISEDQTYCPNDFNEFYKQRRRWIPSTLANLAMLIFDFKTINKENDSISLPFILFQALMVFSTMISPATVILVIASGLQSAYKISNGGILAIIGILIAVSVIYGIICLVSSQKMQLDVAQVLTFIFAILMAVVVAGIFKDTIFSLFPGPKKIVLTAPNCTEFVNTNASEEYEKCLDAARIAESLINSLDTSWKVPVSTTTLYIGVLAITFTAAALLHLPEWSNLLHCLWYLLALPSGYLILLIYSAANLDSQSWGTREGGGDRELGLFGWIVIFKDMMVRQFWKRKRKDDDDQDDGKDKPGQGKKDNQIELESISSRETSPTPVQTKVPVHHKTIDDETYTWLNLLGCGDLAHNFEEHGYTNLHFIAAMQPVDFEEIGVEERGFRLRLIKAARKLPSLPIETNIPDCVQSWLQSLEMEEYINLFHALGYETEDDIENLKGLTRRQMKAMGITKRAHIQRLESALKNLFYPSEVDRKIRETKFTLEQLPEADIATLNKEEAVFWEGLIEHTLKPVTVRFTQIGSIQQSLRTLRNMMLILLLLVNFMWITLLYTLDFPQLVDYGLDPRGFQLLFLAVYGFIIIVQFLTLLCHRAVTLVHYFGRIKPSEVTKAAINEIDFVDISFLDTTTAAAERPDSRI